MLANRELATSVFRATSVLWCEQPDLTQIREMTTTSYGVLARNVLKLRDTTT